MSRHIRLSCLQSICENNKSNQCRRIVFLKAVESIKMDSHPLNSIQPLATPSVLAVHNRSESKLDSKYSTWMQLNDLLKTVPNWTRFTSLCSLYPCLTKIIAAAALLSWNKLKLHHHAPFQLCPAHGSRYQRLIGLAHWPGEASMNT